MECQQRQVRILMRTKTLARWSRDLLVLGCAVALAFCPVATRAAENELKDYRTVKNAAKATIQKQKTIENGQSGFLGIEVKEDSRGRLTVDNVADGSPAARAG